MIPRLRLQPNLTKNSDDQKQHQTKIASNSLRPTHELSYSQHALDELVRRTIPQSFADAVLTNPEQIVDTPDSMKAYQSRVDFGGGHIFLLRVIVAEDEVPNVVATVYRTSKISKYWRVP